MPKGYFGQFGGNHYPPRVRPALEELASTYQELRQSPEFQRELNKVQIGLRGRPTPVHYLSQNHFEAGRGRSK